MKNLLSHLVALAIGIGIGYFIWGRKEINVPLDETRPVLDSLNLEKLSKFYPKQALKDVASLKILIGGDDKADNLVYSEAKDAIRNYNIAQTLGLEIDYPFSYAINYEFIKKILKNTTNDGDNLRIYPAIFINPTDKTKGTFKFILAHEFAPIGTGAKYGKMDIDKNNVDATTGKNTDIWDYMRPCPPYCPDEIVDDFFTCNEIQVMRNARNLPKLKCQE